MKYVLIITVSIIGLSQCSPQVHQSILKKFEDKPVKEFFKVFHLLFGKKYDLNSEEGVKRYYIFKQNVKLIKETNAKKLSYEFGVNQFTDLTS